VTPSLSFAFTFAPAAIAAFSWAAVPGDDDLVEIGSLRERERQHQRNRDHIDALTETFGTFVDETVIMRLGWRLR
jgi:hypothetical protein